MAAKQHEHKHGQGRNEHLPAPLRRQRMLEIIHERGFVRVSELGEVFRISDVTVRADLDALGASAAIRRVHGGAIAGSRHLLQEPSFEESLTASASEKQAIGAAAAGLVVPGQSVVLDVGTTTAAIANALVARPELDDIVVITNGLNIALALEAAIPRFQVVVTGGTLRPLQHSLVDPLGTHVLHNLHADIAFIGCNGVHADHGVTNVNLPEAELKQLMLASATRGVVVADSSKLGQVHLGRIGALTDFDTLITGGSASTEALEPLAATALNLILV